MQNKKVYGAKKTWHQMKREGFIIARCTVERLMKTLGIHGVIRGKRQKTTFSDSKAICPLNQVSRNFRATAPNMLWVSDFKFILAAFLIGKPVSTFP